MTTRTRSHNKANIILWIIQGVLCALFLFAGVSKLVMPIEAMTQQIHLPGVFLRFIGIVEISGALGLVLPGIFKRHSELTSLAAAGLVVVMIGATSISLTMGAVVALFPFIVGILSATVAVGRIRVAPHRGSSLRLVLRAA